MAKKVRPEARSEQLKNAMEYLDLESITPYEFNEKKHPEQQVHRIAKSINKYGFIQPLVVDGKNTVIIGHGRYLAAKRLNVKTVPVIRKEDLTEEEITELRLLDNKLNESEWDAARLGLHGKDLLISVGFRNEELERLFEKVKVKDNGDDSKDIQAMMLADFEKYDYLVFIFRNEFDWLNAMQKFGVQKMHTSFSEKTKQIGLGRILEGKILLGEKGGAPVNAKKQKQQGK